MGITRREFIESAAVATGALKALDDLTARSAQAGEKKTVSAEAAIPIVDTHQHLWDLAKLRLPWLKGAGPLNRSYVMKDYLEAAQGLGIVKAVYMEVDVDPADQVAEAEYILDICRQGKSPTCAAVIGGRPGADSFRQYISRFKDSPYVKGVRQIFPGPESGRAFFLEKPFPAGIRLLGELGMSFDLCMPAMALPEGMKLVDLCPDTRFILDHCGNADVKRFLPASRREPATATEASGRFVDRWRRGIDALAKRKNLVCKISGIVATVPKQWTPEDLAPIIHHCLDSFGPDRVMFASDWPVCTRGATLRQWVEALRQVVRNRSETERRKLWGGNATRFYGLGPQLSSVSSVSRW
jgi:predicted TIM-barrel fold metal-dependent hydrolase